jgi:hypothetical protein
MTQLNQKEVQTLRRLDRKIGNGKATRAEVMRAIALKRRAGSAAAFRVGDQS